jgi:hypothetical protein
MICAGERRVRHLASNAISNLQSEITRTLDLSCHREGKELTSHRRGLFLRKVSTSGIISFRNKEGIVRRPFVPLYV